MTRPHSDPDPHSVRLGTLLRTGLALGTAGLALLATPRSLRAQASPYLAIRDPATALIEHLITRGEIADPSPMVRPFRRSDLLAALAKADTLPGSRGAALVRELCAKLALPTGKDWWRAGGRLGVEGYSHGRRDQLHPQGPSGIEPYVEADLAAVFGPMVLVSRPAIQRRVTDDPDWRGRRNVEVPGRLVDGYLSAQFRFGEVTYGQLDRNWGPTGVDGIPLSPYGYERQALGFSVGNRTLRLSALASDLMDETDSAGQTVHRYYFAHRLDLSISRHLRLGLWETSVIAGVDRQFETRYRNPLSISYLANTIGLGDQGNVMLGLDATWQPRRRVTIQAQLALDDLTYENRDAPDRNPNRWAFTLSAAGAMGRNLSWRALYTQASSLAFRTFDDQFQDFTDAGVGIGRNFADNDQASVSLSLPVRGRWLVTPEVTFLRQGQGQIDDPYPTGTARGDTPQLFIGTVERTLRLALNVAGEEGPLRLSGSAGLNQVSNANHVDGRNRAHFVGQVMATLGFIRAGVFH